MMAVDWGITQLRAYQLDATAAVLASRSAPNGSRQSPLDNSRRLWSRHRRPAGTVARTRSDECQPTLRRRPPELGRCRQPRLISWPISMPER